MKKVVLVAIIAMLTINCGAFSRAKASFTGHDIVCIEGINYVQFASGGTVLFDRHGNVVPCN